MRNSVIGRRFVEIAKKNNHSWAGLTFRYVATPDVGGGGRERVQKRGTRPKQLSPPHPAQLASRIFFYSFLLLILLLKGGGEEA